MKRYQFPIILVAILATLGGIAYWDEWKTKQEEKLESTKNKLTEFNGDEVTRIDLSVAASEANGTPIKIGLEKAGSTWSLVEPLRAPADQAAVKNLLQAVTDYKYESKVTDDKSKFAQYGLDKPRRSLLLTLGKDRKIEVLVGTKAPVGFSSYVSLGDSPNVYIGSQHIDSALDKKATDFRDRTLVVVRSENVLEFGFQNAKTALTISRKSAQESLRITKPKEADADVDAINDFIASIASEKIEDFIDSPDAKVLSALNSNKRLSTINWQLVDGEKQQLDFADLNGKLYVRNQTKNAVYTLAAAFKTKLERDFNSFLDKTVLKFKSADIAEVEVDGDVFVKEKDNWIKKGDAEQKPAAHIGSLITDLEFAKADKFVEANAMKSISAAAPKHKVKLVFSEASKRPPVSIEGWPEAKNGDRWYLRHSERIDMFEVRAGIFANTSSAPPQGQPSTPAALGEPPVNLPENMGGTDEG